MPLETPNMGDPPKSERVPVQTVGLPMPLYHQMALCFYGEGPRYWELTTGKTASPTLSPHPETPVVPPGAFVPDVPPDWKRVKVKEDADSDVQATS